MRSPLKKQVSGNSVLGTWVITQIKRAKQCATATAALLKGLVIRTLVNYTDNGSVLLPAQLTRVLAP
jgi:hypothetical protein